MSAQEESGFRLFKEMFIKGSAKAIGNNIVSLDSKEPYNKVGYHAEKNDRLSMVYVDIDEDPNTFSSSTAMLISPKNYTRVAYAGLFWSAVYEYEEGKIKKVRGDYEYIVQKERQEDFNTILFKGPSNNYNSILGTVLEDHKDSIGRPYLCYADVTKVLNSNSEISGNYTVANMRATQGHVLGGSSGGWLLYVVFENPADPLQKFMLYNGFRSVEKESYSIEFSGFNPSKNEIRKANLSLGVLEGDERLKTDILSISSSTATVPKELSSKARLRNNFFNSTISNNGEISMDRIPNSINTLGLDIASFELEDNQLITSSTESVKLDFETVRDKFLIFFLGFQIEVATKDALVNNEVSIVKDTIASQGIGEDKIEVRETLQISNLEKGYYLITNIFSNPDLANNWKDFLREKGYNPMSFINPKNNWEYVYVVKGDEISDCYEYYVELKGKKDFEEVWVLELTN